MKPAPHILSTRAKKSLAYGLVALLAASTAMAQVDDASVRRLQEENAALRRQLAEMQGRTAPAATATTPATSMTPAQSAPVQATDTASSSYSPENPDTLQLSPFEVKSDKDFGYLKTNAATATRIGMAIQNVPMNISVLSEDFIRDANIQSITDVLRYTSSGSPDSRFAMRRPGNSATPQGNFTLRGFTVNSLLRNGVFRYNSYNLDNVERVEIVKGPAAVFFGQGYPGGVINYITKKPMFGQTNTTLSYAIDDNGGDKVVLDHNAGLGEKAALRVVGSWSDLGGDRTGEFRKGFNITPSLSLVPFKSGKLKINMELEYLKERYNENDYGWIYPQGWFDAYQNPSAALITASGVADATAYRARIFNSVGNWIADVRKAQNDPTLPAYTTLSNKGYYLNKAGQKVADEAFNFTNSGSYTDNEVKTFQTTVEFSPLSWLDARYVFTKDNSTLDNIEGLNAPNADGMTYNAASGGNGSGYYRRVDDHQLDIILKGTFFGVKNKLLLGGVYSRPLQQYMAPTGAVYFAVPGYNYPTPGPIVLPGNLTNLVPVNQVLRDRNGNILTAQQVYSMWDPGVQINPPTSKIFNVNRNLLDGYKGKNTAYYANWQANLLKDDKLTILGGYRKEYAKGYGQSLVSNDPWFAPPEDAYLNQAQYPADVYNYGPSYSGDPEGFRTRNGDSWMTGLSYAITPEISVYATVSKTFKINTGLAGGFDELGLDRLLTAALANNGGSFNYRGKTFTDVAGGRAVLTEAGAFQSLSNESGKNFEVGVKTTLWDGKLVGTLSVFRGIRENQKLDDSQRQSAAEEPFNFSTTAFASTATDFYNRRNFRWRSVGVKNQITGTDFDVIYTPMRNYQIMVNGAWMWQAETIDFPAYPHPGSTAYNAASVANKALYSLYYNNRIENVPEFRLNFFNKYTFTAQPVHGLHLGFGGRYSSETIVSRSLDWNPDRGGVTVGNYLVFDATIGYPWELFGYKLETSLNVNNVLNREYYEGNVAPSDSRSWILRTTVAF